MASFNISLSDELREYVQAQVRSGAYGNVSEYFRNLIREQQRRAVQEKLELLLLEGIESGSGGPMTKADWEELRQVALKRAENRLREKGVTRKNRTKDKAGSEGSGRNRGLSRRGLAGG
jgi:antitoxin ParD1/3/4